MPSPQSDLIHDGDRYLQPLGPRRAVRVVVVDDYGEHHVIPRRHPPGATPDRAESENAPMPELSRCAVQAARALERLGRFASVEDIRADMQAHGHEWSEKTIRNALKVLKSLGVVKRDDAKGGFAFASQGTPSR